MNDVGLLPRTHNEPPLEDMLAELSAPLIRRRDDLLGSVDRAPEVNDEDSCGKVSDLVRMIRACAKAAEGRRVATKEPSLAEGRLIDATFMKITEPLDKAKRTLEQRITIYQRVKAEAERRVREAEARRIAEEAERQRREAEAAAAAIVSEQDVDDAISAGELARQQEADAERARRAAEAKPAEMSRSRGDLGAVASLRTYWDFADLARDTLDLEPLRAHLPQDALEKAVRSFVRAGGRELLGVRIFENTATSVR